MNTEEILEIINKSNPAIEFQENKEDIIHRILVRCLLELTVNVGTLDFIYAENFLTSDQKLKIKQNTKNINKLRDSKIKDLLKYHSIYF